MVQAGRHSFPVTPYVSKCLPILPDITWGCHLRSGSACSPRCRLSCCCMDVIAPIILVMAEINSLNLCSGMPSWTGVGPLLLTDPALSPCAPSTSPNSSPRGGSFIKCLDSSSWPSDFPLFLADFSPDA